MEELDDMEELDLEKLPDGVIVKVKGFETDEVDSYYIKLEDKLINNTGFIYIDEYNGNLNYDYDDYNIEEVWYLPIYEIDISYIVKKYILENDDFIQPKLIYKNTCNDIMTLTVKELKEKMESILGCQIRVKL